MKKNVGDLDSFLRITAGLSMLGIGIRKNCNPLIMLGSMKVAEGITRYCPLLSLMGISTEQRVI
ncbi:YgaP family membrane protein [Wukongibacter sp. M2B1]|uniref:YgaP family membrane protein n=1 Tax=Wukongibacter sp. M2B1 TaxID=3088895 RepID=UPI003D7C104E